MGEFTDYLI